MDLIRIRQRETALIIIVIIAFAILGLWLRLLPMEQLTSGPVQKVIFVDPWYSLRQIEVIASNFPEYPWFDPMNGYPAGKEIEWGPLYPILSASLAILFGAGTRAEIVSVVSWIPPLASLIMIPLLYTIGKIVADRKTGIIASCLISIIAGEYLYRSFYGYLDHHFLEVILSTAFLLIYLIIIRIININKEKKPWNNRNLMIYSILAGIVYYLGMMNMPTIVLFTGIIGIFCFSHALITRDEYSLKNLTVAHAILFGVFILLFSFTGLTHQGLSLERYTPIHIVLGILLIIEPLFLGVVCHIMSGKSRLKVDGVMIGIPVLSIVGASLLVPTITSIFYNGFKYFFFATYELTNISETKMWDLTRAYNSFNIALLLMIAGLIISTYYTYKKYDPIKLLTLIWAIIILISTILHLRYEYYVAVIVVLYSSVALVKLYDFLCEKLSSDKKRDRNTEGNKKFQARVIPFITITIIILIITALSIQITWVVATKQLKIASMNDDWADSLLWLEQNSPEPGIDYLKIYEKEGFSYPEKSYGILSWWEYGHWITELGRRIPITSPFQNNVAQVAQFLLATDEKTADGLANETGAKYIIIDYEMLSSKYPSLPLWAFGSAGTDKYQKYYYQQSTGNQNQYDPILTLKPDYFNSMLSRLYVFDGTMTNSTGANLVSYTNMQIGGQLIPTVSKIAILSPEQAEKTLNEGIAPGTDLVAIQYTHPIATIPALSHYRLVYESPTVTASDEYAQIHNVKIFERVTGYQISGTGTIEIPLITNQGRSFMYRQNSSNGLFTVPYSTQRDGNGTRATGPYKNVQTGETYEVTEDQIQTSQQ